MGVRPQKKVRGMERVWNRVWNALVTKLKILNPNLEWQAPTHDPLRVPHEHSLTKRHRLNKSRLSAASMIGSMNRA